MQEHSFELFPSPNSQAAFLPSIRVIGRAESCGKGDCGVVRQDALQIHRKNTSQILILLSMRIFSYLSRVQPARLRASEHSYF